MKSHKLKKLTHLNHIEQLSFHENFLFLWKNRRIGIMKSAYLFIIVTSLLLSFPAIASEDSFQQRVTQTEPAPIEISAYDSCIHVKNAPIGSVLEIYSVVGIKVKEIKIKESNGEYPVNIPKGYYIIRIGETVRKIVIR